MKWLAVIRTKKHMKNCILWGIAVGTLMACHSPKELNRQEFAVITEVPAPLNTPRLIRDTMAAEEKPEPLKSEKIVKTQGCEIRHYCVIVGSFIYAQNAIHLRKQLIRQGFLGSSILKNDEGMYRVSAVCDNSHEEAWREVCRIRSQYPQYHEAWLLEVAE